MVTPASVIVVLLLVSPVPVSQRVQSDFANQLFLGILFLIQHYCCFSKFGKILLTAECAGGASKRM